MKVCVYHVEIFKWEFGSVACGYPFLCPQCILCIQIKDTCFQIFYYFNYVNICLYNTYVWCPEKIDCVGFNETGITGSCDLSNVGAWNLLLPRQKYEDQ